MFVGYKELYDRTIEYNSVCNRPTIKMLKNKYRLAQQKLNRTNIKSLYNDIVDDIVDLSDVFDFTDPFSISCFYEYLLWNGYLSQDKKFSFNKKFEYNIDSLTGSKIFLGKGNCLNISPLLTDILKKKNIETHNIATYVGNIKNVGYKSIYIAQNVEEEKGIVNPLVKLIILNREKKCGNHAVSLFKYNDYFFLADPTNSSFLYVNSFLTAKYNNTKDKVKLFPFFSLFSEDIKEKEYIELINDLYNQKKCLRKNTDEVYKKVIKVLEDNKDIVDDFYKREKDLYKEISKEVKIYTKK